MNTILLSFDYFFNKGDVKCNLVGCYTCFMFKFLKNSVKTIESRTIWIQNCLVDLILSKYNVQTSKKEKTKTKKIQHFSMLMLGQSFFLS